MRHTTAFISLLSFALLGGPSVAASEGNHDKCALKVELIEKHLHALQPKYIAAIQAAPTETQARAHVKRRVNTLLVDVRRSLEHTACASQQRTQLLGVKASLEEMMRTDI